MIDAATEGLLRRLRIKAAMVLDADLAGLLLEAANRIDADYQESLENDLYPCEHCG